jgi:GDPmannose 4,6-dehydratase
MKKALITGISGQDGSYLSELLLEKGYEVHGFERRVSSENHLLNIKHIKDKLILHSCDIRSYEQIVNFIKKEKYDEIYHLAAQSFVGDSFKDPYTTYETNFKGTLNILEAVKTFNPTTKIYFAGTSEMFGDVLENIQNEKTPFNPTSPYAISKLGAFYLCKTYRTSYNLFICSGILFNHESPRRGKQFVTQKIIHGLKNISENKQNILELGNIDSIRDWGHSKDYVNAMYLMLQHDTPDDYIVATGETHTVREFAEETAKHLGYELIWKGKNINEVGYDKITNKELIVINPKYYRPTDVNFLKGDASKIREILNWKTDITFSMLIKDMLDNIRE